MAIPNNLHLPEPISLYGHSNPAASSTISGSSLMYSSSTDTSSHWCFQPCLHNCPLSFFKPVCFNFNFQSSPLQPRLSSVCLSGYSGSLLLILPSESLLSPLGFVPTLSMLLLLLLPSRCSTLQVLRCALTSRSQNIQKN